MAKEKNKIDALLYDLTKGKTPEELLGENGLLAELTKRLAEQALEGEMVTCNPRLSIWP